MLRIIPPSLAAARAASAAPIPVAPLADDKLGREDRTALICCHEPEYQEFLAVQLREQQFKVHHAKSHQQAIQRIASRNYDVTVLLENLESCALEQNALLRFLQAMATDDRRQTFVILLCGSFATGDTSHAYAQSIDLLINYQDISQFSTLAASALEEHEEETRFFKAALRK